jgi:transcriptional regulator of arginine metabolism
MARSARQAKILDLIEKHEIETQEELCALLFDEGEEVTQATVSRDIKELELVKVMGGNKKYRYAAPHEASGTGAKLVNMFRESLVSMDRAGNLIVLKTLSGSANAAGMLVDKLKLTGVLGCVAGDDTVFIAVADDARAEDALAALTELLK